MQFQRSGRSGLDPTVPEVGGMNGGRCGRMEGNSLALNTGVLGPMSISGSRVPMPVPGVFTGVN